MNRIVLVFATAALMGCEGANIAGDAALAISEINSVPRFGNGEILYFYNSHQAEPEALLAGLRSAGIPVLRGWMPLDNQCTDIIGPRFTVELSAEDPRMTQFGFSKGEGRLGCATKLRLYVVN